MVERNLVAGLERNRFDHGGTVFHDDVPMEIVGYPLLRFFGTARRANFLADIDIDRTCGLLPTEAGALLQASERPPLAAS